MQGNGEGLQVLHQTRRPRRRGQTPKEEEGVQVLRVRQTEEKMQGNCNRQLLLPTPQATGVEETPSPRLWSNGTITAAHGRDTTDDGSVEQELGHYLCQPCWTGDEDVEGYGQQRTLGSGTPGAGDTTISHN